MIDDNTDNYKKIKKEYFLKLVPNFKYFDYLERYDALHGSIDDLNLKNLDGSDGFEWCKKISVDGTINLYPRSLIYVDGTLDLKYLSPSNFGEYTVFEKIAVHNDHNVYVCIADMDELKETLSITTTTTESSSIEDPNTEELASIEYPMYIVRF